MKKGTRVAHATDRTKLGSVTGTKEGVPLVQWDEGSGPSHPVLVGRNNLRVLGGGL